ncbi:MAG: tol-pal system protein YbgF [Rhodobacter sp.]|nr:tol-pal system protein YbgF [Rhodobacter sp.]
MQGLRWMIAAAALAVWPLAPVAAQDQTLADIRQELSVLFVDIQRLKRELSTTAGPSVAAGGGTVLDRVNRIEAELQRLTARTEELEFRVSRVVSDGTNRIGDLEFRLCELEPGCEVGSLGETPTLGGEAATPVAVAPVAAPQTGGETQMAMGEQADFDRAVAALEGGDLTGAAEMFQTFAATYPGGPLNGEAHYLRGEALTGLGETAAAARAYLESYSGWRDGPRAPSALLRLGESLADLGQTREACIMLDEVATRYPGAPEVDEAAAESQRLGCS